MWSIFTGKKERVRKDETDSVRERGRQREGDRQREWHVSFRGE